MALRNQPYLPLYVQDVLTDEKLIECSAKSQGVYFRLLCVLHKQNEYGKFLLKQKYKQSEKQVENFASSLVRPLALPFDVILSSLIELIDEGVVSIDGDFICQKRMIKDAELSDKRAKAGSKGGKKAQSKDSKVAKAKKEANTEIENETENEIEALFEKVKDYFDIEIPKKSTKETFDKLIRIDGYTAEQIERVCREMRANEFWKPNFQSPLKLRRKDKDKVKYIDRFIEIIKSDYEQRRKGAKPNAHKTQERKIGFGTGK